jgi:hypothetical protein
MDVLNFNAMTGIIVNENDSERRWFASYYIITYI